MISFFPLASKVFMFSLLIVPGFILARKKLIAESAIPSLTNILMYVAMPFLVFGKLCMTDLSLLNITDILFCVFFAFFAVIAAFFVARGIFFKRDDSRRPVAVFCASFSNCGFLGIPLTAYLFPDSPRITVFISLYNVFGTFLLLTLGVYELSRDRACINILKACVSPVGIAVLAGFVFSLTGIGGKFTMIGEYSEILASLTLPLSMLVLGTELSKLKIGEMLKEKDVYICSLFKLLVLPMLIIFVILFLKVFGLCLSSHAVAAVVIASALSTAASATAMANKYKLDSEYAAALTLSNTLFCVLSFPVIYLFAAWLLGI